MPNLPYDEEDLLIEAAKQYANKTCDTDLVAVGEAMTYSEITSLLPPGEADGAEGPAWGDMDDEQFAEAQNRIHKLINGAADLSEWAVEMGAAELDPYGVKITINAGDKAFLSVNFGFAASVPEKTRMELAMKVGRFINENM
jgi:hypothetical protein